MSIIEPEGASERTELDALRRFRPQEENGLILSPNPPLFRLAKLNRWGEGGRVDGVPGWLAGPRPTPVLVFSDSALRVSELIFIMLDLGDWPIPFSMAEEDEDILRLEAGSDD
jgi:hypothetical protein